MLRLLLLAVIVGAESHSAGRQTAFDVTAVYNSNQEPVASGAQGPGVVRAQILLSRAHFSCGAIDGNFGTNLQKTVLAYQNDRHLDPTGALDIATWAALNADQAPPLLPYTITADDEAGPFVQIPNDLMKQAMLPALGYSSPLEELAERFHASPQLLQTLNPGANFSKVGQQLTVPNAITMPPGNAATVSVSKSDSSVRALGPDGKLLAYYVATIGSEHDPLPVGAWKVLGVKRDPIFHYDSRLFWDAKKGDEQADLPPGPNNPVGVVWISLSKEHYGIHGTPDASLIGHAQSHGCIRLTNWDALELSGMVKPGTPALLQE